jgi:alpha/beta superfamily hydrolase
MTLNSTTSTRRLLIPGPAGNIEVFHDEPHGAVAGFAIITHPHPLQGGTAEHKIPQIIARACQENGYVAVRPNFRGVGGTAGTHDAGRGETDDVLYIVRSMRSQYPQSPIILAGFSFGAYVQALVGQRLAREDAVRARLILVGAPSGVLPAGREYDTPPVPEDSLIIHGECDDVVPLSSVLDWARPQDLPVVVIPGARHFLTGAIPTLRRVLNSHLKVST